MPEQNGTIAASGTEQALMAGMPGDTGGFLFVTSEGLHFRTEVSDIEQLQQVIPRGSHKPVAVLVPFHVHHCGLVGVQRR